jgi:hypothetical protein
MIGIVRVLILKLYAPKKDWHDGVRVTTPKAILVQRLCATTMLEAV